MPLATDIIALIRDEIGTDLDFVDNIADETGAELDSLENIYTDPERGNFDVLWTALIAMRRRRNSYVNRGWDASTGGTLMARRQKMLELDRRVKELELLVDTTDRHRQSQMQSKYMQEDTGAEFS